jgi:uncharacterized UPF0146 family protein
MKKFTLLCLILFNSLFVWQLYADVISAEEVQKLVASDRTGNDNFGKSVSIDGNYAIVGATGQDSDENGANNVGAAYIYKINTDGSWTQVQKLVTSDAKGGDYFGTSVSISGDYAIVGSSVQDYDENGENKIDDAGAAYIFKNTNGTWKQQQKIVASDRTDSDNFGKSVSIDGDYAIVGAYDQDSAVNGSDYKEDAGAAYIFELEGDTWKQQQKLVASDRTEGDMFGYSVSIDGDYAIVGAYGQDSAVGGGDYKSYAGAAYIFELEGDTWKQQQKLVASDRTESDYFGKSVSIDGDYAIVGAYGQDSAVGGGDYKSYAGAAYIFKNADDSWTQVKKLVASDRTAGDYFGCSVSIDGDYAIVGVYKQDSAVDGSDYKENAGAAYIFKNTDETWSETQKIVASDRTKEDYFGYSVSIAGDYAIVGAYQQDSAVGGGDYKGNAGAAYIFELQTIFSGGTGTEADPWQIATMEDLDSLSANSEYWDDYFIQTAGIDADTTASETYNSGAGFSPIGHFTGTYNAQGYTISNLYINLTDKDSIGLFGVVGKNGIIENLSLKDVSISGKKFTGAVVGWSYGTVKNTNTSGTINGYGFTGGLVGYLKNGSISKCYFTGSVTGGDEDNTGGVAGKSYGGDIKYCYSSGYVTGVKYTGGLVGYNRDASVNYCYSTCNVTGSENGAGGLLGDNYGGTIKNCYSSGQTIGNSEVGGFVGIETGTLTNCYWDTKNSGLSSGIGNNNNNQTVTGYSTDSMKIVANFLNWEINETNSVWVMRTDSTYPALHPDTIGNNAPFAFADSVSINASINLDTVLANDYDYETLQTALTYKTISCTENYGSVSENIYTVSNTTTADVYDTVYYQIGEVITDGDTLWGNQAAICIYLLPTLTLNDTTAYLDKNGEIILASSGIIESAIGGTDTTFAINSNAIDTLNCSDLGESYKVVVSLICNGTTLIDSAEIYVDDTLKPILEIPESYTLYLDNTGNTRLYSADVVSSATDNCSIRDTSITLINDDKHDFIAEKAASVSYDYIDFTCDNINTENKVIVTLLDANNNTSVDTILIYVKDTVNPELTVESSFNLYLDSSGNAVFHTSDIVTDATDNCSIKDTSICINTEDKAAYIAITPSTDTIAFSCDNKGTNSVTVTLTDNEGNSISQSVNVYIDDTLKPILETPEDYTLYLDSIGNTRLYSADIVSSATDNCSPQDTSIILIENSNSNLVAEKAVDMGSDSIDFTCDNINTDNQVVVTLRDAEWNKTYDTVTVNIEDTIKPLLEIPESYTVYLDNSGEAMLYISDIIDSTADNCSIQDTFMILCSSNEKSMKKTDYGTDSIAFDCDNISSENKVAVTLLDANNNTSVDTILIYVKDTVNPELTVESSFKLYLDSSGNAILYASDVISNATDNCSTQASICLTNNNQKDFVAEKAASSLSNKIEFSCNDKGSTSVTVTLTDNDENSVSQSVNIYVYDTLNPTLETPEDYTLYLDSNGKARLYSADIVSSATDNCSPQDTSIILIENSNSNLIAEKAVDMGSDSIDFTCDNINTDNQVVVTLRDAEWNKTYDTVTVNIEDTINPLLEIPESYTVYLDNSGEAMLYISDIIDSTADNCSIQDTFMILCSSNEKSIKKADYGTDSIAFDCDNISSENKVIVTLLDANNNTSVDTILIYVKDTVNPELTVESSFNLYLDSSGNAVFHTSDIVTDATDNCSIKDTSICINTEDKAAYIAITPSTDTIAFSCDNKGTNSVTVTLTDNEGNSISQSVNIYVYDTLNPIIEAHNYTAYLDKTGNTFVVPFDLIDNTSDNCAVNDSFINIVSDEKSLWFGSDSCFFDCDNIGENSVRITITDDEGNYSFDTVTVTIADSTKPILIVNDIHATLNSSGEAIKSTSNIISEVSDNCSLGETTMSQTYFTCDDIGENTVTVTATDAQGNIATATAIVSVTEEEAPMLEVQNITVALDSNGSAIATAAELVTLATDNCTLADTSLSISDFNCENLGDNKIAITLTDLSGNSTSDSAIVTIIDTIAPVFNTIEDVEVVISFSSPDSTTITYPELTADDNCNTELSLISGLGENGLFPIGTSTETWVATDASGNTDTISFDVVVSKTEPTTALKIMAFVNNQVIHPDSIEYTLFLKKDDNNFTDTTLNYSITGDTAIFNIVAGDWIIRGTSTAEDPAFMTTYYGDVENWEDASIVSMKENETSVIAINCIVNNATEEKGNGSISGYVVKENDSNKSGIVKSTTTEDKEPVEGALVRLYFNNDTTLLKTTETDNQGLYKFINLPSGAYFVEVDIPGLTQSQKYEVSIDSVNANDSISFVAYYGSNVITDSDLEELSESIDVFPNPTHDKVTINLNGISGDVDILVFNMKGQKILQQKGSLPETTISLAGNTNGLYLIKVITTKQQTIKKVILK